MHASPSLCCFSSKASPAALHGQRQALGVQVASFRPAQSCRPPLRKIFRSAAYKHAVVLSADTEEKEADEDRGEELDNPDSEASRKAQEAERLRAAEKFMKVGTGEATCKGCGYEYSPSKGDPEYPISAGTYFDNLPKDWQCPICGAEKYTFESKAREIAGFAENQGYGFGTNTMTSGQKSLLIYGSLAAFFALFLFGYLLQ